jgi:hypothetical protein
MGPPGQATGGVTGFNNCYRIFAKNDANPFVDSASIPVGYYHSSCATCPEGTHLEMMKCTDLGTHDDFGLNNGAWALETYHPTGRGLECRWVKFREGGSMVNLVATAWCCDGEVTAPKPDYRDPKAC